MHRFCFFSVALVSSLCCLSAAPAATPKPAEKTNSFRSFTGKVIGNKVRIRVKADLDSPVLRQINKNELVLVLGQEGEFYAVQPPKGTKAYVFRTYILDDVVEADRVNVRLEPHVDAPIIGQLRAGDKVKGQVSAVNHKWLEITPPSSTRFYVSKEFIGEAGGPEYITQMEQRKIQAQTTLDAAFAAADLECKKNYEEMSPHLVVEQFQHLIRSYPDFPEVTAQAKEGLALLKETYLNKKIEYLEAKAQLTPTVKEELLNRHREESRELFAETSPRIDPNLFTKKGMKRSVNGNQFWETIEESLYLSWTAFHSGRSADEFYAEQKANSSLLKGFVVPYDHPVKNRPGDYLLKSEEGPIAYLYSTSIDLSTLVGKEVTLLGSPRPNNHFAFPAYYVLGVDTP